MKREALSNAEGRKLLAQRPRAKAKDQAELFPAALGLAGDRQLGIGWFAECGFEPGRRWRFDWARPSEKVAVEVDGGRWMPGGGRHGSDADRCKLNEAAALGWRVLRFSPKQLRDDPLGCADVVRRALALGRERR